MKNKTFFPQVSQVDIFSLIFFYIVLREDFRNLKG